MTIVIPRKVKNNLLNFADIQDKVNEFTYQEWRDHKLSAYPLSNNDLIVNINSMKKLTTNEKIQIIEYCSKYNMAIYQCRHKKPLVNAGVLIQFAENFELKRLNHHRYAGDGGISELSVTKDRPKEEFIPYTNQQLGWHTDGYYNQRSERVHAFILHCVQPATEGGGNSLLDPDIAYIRLRDENPQYIRALMANDCMIIPGYDMGDGKRRPACIGPVFDFDPRSSKLHMRYTARKRSIIWKEDKLTSEAIAFLTKTLDSESCVITHKLEAGQGLIANNVLHNRTSFRDNPDNKRLLYRARYLERVTITNSH